MQVRDLADLFACKLDAEHLVLFDDTSNESKQVFTQRIRRVIGLAAHRGWENCFSADSATLFRSHGSRVLTHTRQMRTALR